MGIKKTTTQQHLIRLFPFFKKKNPGEGDLWKMEIQVPARKPILLDQILSQQTNTSALLGGGGGMKGTKLWLILTSQFPHTEIRIKGPKMLANRQRVPKLKISV